MNRSILGALLASVILCAAILWYSVPNQSVNAQPAAKAQQWEYKFAGELKELKAEKIEEQFNKLGSDGWEYVGDIGGRGELVFFKRPKR